MIHHMILGLSSMMSVLNGVETQGNLSFLWMELGSYIFIQWVGFPLQSWHS